MPTPDEWRARAQSWITAGTEWPAEVTSADKAYAWMRDHAYYIPRQYVRDVWRESVYHKGYVPLINRLSDEQLIPRRWQQTGYQEIPTNYRYIVRIEGTVRETGEPMSRTIAIDTDDAMSLGEIRDDAEQAAEIYEFEMIGIGERIYIEATYHRRGATWG